jgi:hypothetical protein
LYFEALLLQFPLKLGSRTERRGDDGRLARGALARNAAGYPPA